MGGSSDRVGGWVMDWLDVGFFMGGWVGMGFGMVRYKCFWWWLVGKMVGLIHNYNPKCTRSGWARLVKIINHHLEYMSLSFIAGY